MDEDPTIDPESPVDFDCEMVEEPTIDSETPVDWRIVEEPTIDPEMPVNLELGPSTALEREVLSTLFEIFGDNDPVSVLKLTEAQFKLLEAIVYTYIGTVATYGRRVKRILSKGQSLYNFLYAMCINNRNGLVETFKRLADMEDRTNSSPVREVAVHPVVAATLASRLDCFDLRGIHFDESRSCLKLTKSVQMAIINGFAQRKDL